MLKPKKIVFSLAAATLLAALSLAEIYNMRPFGTGLFSALLMFDVPVWLTAPVYLVTNAAFCRYGDMPRYAYAPSHSKPLPPKSKQNLRFGRFCLAEPWETAALFMPPS